MLWSGNGSIEIVTNRRKYNAEHENEQKQKTEKCVDF